MSLYRATSRAGLSGYISRGFRPKSDNSFSSIRSGRCVSLNNPVSQSPYSDSLESYKSNVACNGSVWFSNLEKLSSNLASMKVKQHLHSPSCLSFRRFVHRGSAKLAEDGSTFRPMDFVRGIMEERGGGRFEDGRLRDGRFGDGRLRDGRFGDGRLGDGRLRDGRFGDGRLRDGRFGGFQFPQINNEENADILRITMLRNNTFVALTDSKGQKKPGVCASAGTLPDNAGKDSRYSAEAAAEHVGREAKKAGVKTVVVKISGFTHFKRKRQAIMAFREGYTHGRGDQTPIIYIEDKTRKPHNGCRKPKKRRI